MPDFADKLVSWAYDRQVFSDPDQRPVYFGCLRELAEERQSEQLIMQASTLASKGEVTQRELQVAFSSLGMNVQEASACDDQHILSSYQAQFYECGSARRNAMRTGLQVIADYRQSDLLRIAAAEREDLQWRTRMTSRG